MGLQLRIRHALGIRTVEIPGRGGDNPVRIGRDATCDVPIPSGQVGAVHCLLYMHEGQWIVASAGPVVLLNGQKITEPQFIDCGDKVSLGTGHSATVIEIDPVGAARHAATTAPPPTSRPNAPTDTNQQTSRDVGETSPPVGEAESSEAWDNPQGGADEFVSMGTASAAGTKTSSHRKPQKQSSAGLMVGLGVAVLVAGILVIYMLSKPPASVEGPPVVKPAPTGANAVAPSVPVEDKPKTKVAANPQTRPKPVAPVVATDPVNTPPPVVTTKDPEEDTSSKPIGNDPELEAIRNDTLDQPAIAIYKLCEYMQQNPGKSDAEVKKALEDAVDQLWWKRIKKLMENKEQIKLDIESKKGALAAEQPGSEYIKAYEKDVENLQYRLRSVDETITKDMKYTLSHPPNPSDPAQLETLRGERDKKYFETWSKKQIDYIRTNHGRTEW